MADFHFSVLSGAVAAESDDTRLLDVLDRALAAADGPLRWKTVRSGMWAHVRPENGECPQQGWKLHVSATPPPPRTSWPARCPCCWRAVPRSSSPPPATTSRP
ncbi:hypothetical protein ACFQY7_23090 [Actinomadura luteofluorescens]|uniref:class III lanthionine synthetase LanKC N-terminal domain-containing protein n=1 Tax=Actinomadura luteofluorescens TaxID=46163 RepID=UPI00362CBE2F